MAHANKLHPLEINTTTNEVFLRLRRHKNVILTPPRWEDTAGFVENMGDPRVYHWLASTPSPYHQEHAEATLKRAIKRSEATLQELEGANLSEPHKLVNSCPVSSIREVQEDGSEKFIGDIRVGRCSYGELMKTDTIDWDSKEKNEAENEGKQLGDPTILWSLGNFLAPSHHGRGIMTDVLDTVLHDWAVSRMGVRRLLVGIFDGNAGSVRVFEKNGFRSLRVVNGYREVRGEIRDLEVMEWSLNA
ncbi:hypothetical protein GALMADRAFT_373037 [Galerina marginata CBS 339.88]|uniref:N-acetyltransferase domain-containing protein n=1 Tax=Galerina marginata (strain CBS 339.88) TaxID=685588 RepID=A0A067TZZ4_GALM3|nr:hypothetical protein GALMADRAFT_373037 [Galerina marginata CBS 339.88]